MARLAMCWLTLFRRADIGLIPTIIFGDYPLFFKAGRRARETFEDILQEKAEIRLADYVVRAEVDYDDGYGNLVAGKELSLVQLDMLAKDWIDGDRVLNPPWGDDES